MKPRIWLLVFFTFFLIFQAGRCEDDFQRLRKVILDGYDAEAIPDHHDNLTGLNVTFEFGIDWIEELDEINSILRVKVYISETWMDDRLSWTSKQSNLTVISLPQDDIWLPDISLYNHMDISNEDPGTGIAHVSSTGMVTLVKVMLMRSNCISVLTNFPYDTQKCIFKFGSWLHHGSIIDLQLTHDADRKILSRHYRNTKWNISSAISTRNVIFYSCCPEPYVDLTYKITLQRHSSAFYRFTLLVPCLIAAILTLGTFVLPPSSGERIITVCLAALIYFVLLLFLSKTIRPSSRPVASIVSFCSDCLFTVCMAAILSAFSFRISRNYNTWTIPHWLRAMMNNDTILKIFCVSSNKRRVSENIGLNEIPENEDGELVEMSEDEIRDRKHYELTTILKMFDLIYFVSIFLLFILNSIPYFLR